MTLRFTIAILKQGKIINGLAWLMFLTIMLTAYAFFSTKLTLLILIISFIALLIQSYYALRVCLDESFFNLFQLDPHNTELLIQLDGFLLKHQLLKQAKHIGLNTRIDGAMKLIKYQIISFCTLVGLYLTILIGAIIFT